MKKKLLSVLLCTAMTAALFACGGKEDETTTAPTTTEAPTTTAPVAAEKEELPEAFAHITFDGTDEGYTAVEQVADLGSLTGANFGIAPVDVTFGYTDGPVGKCIYLTGKYGLDLNLKPTNTDAYTVSYWMNADRLANYGATLQIGYNMGMAADVGNNVTWMNITQSDWGADAAKIFPIVWSRNEASDAADGTDCWPWMYGWDDSIHGKKEWVHVTVVCSGEVQNSPLGSTTAGAQYYINGVKVYDSADNFNNNTYFEYTWDATLAPNIMKPGDSEFESLFGINYWDTVFKGYVDDLYVFDKALTAGQVASLYALGDPTVKAVAPVVVEEEKNPEIVAQGTLVGKPDFTTGWWQEFSDIYKVEVGETVSKTFINYHSVEASNWNNWVVVLQNVAAGHGADADPAYKEYGVVRCDNYGWAGALNSNDNIAELGWVLENNYDWTNFLKELQGATVKVSVTNNGTTADVCHTITSADENVYTMNYKNIAVDGDLYFCLGVDGACIDIKKEAEATGKLVGAPDCSTGWWQEFSDIYEVGVGETREVNFKNYSSKANNWNNFVVVLQNVAAGHGTDADPAYKEYAVVRSDNYGWVGALNTGANLAELGWVLENNYDWTNFLANLDGADVNVKVTNNGKTADIVATVNGTDGNVYTQSYKNIAVDGPLFFCLGVDGSCIVIE